MLEHKLFEHARVLPHTFPQEPQLALSVFVLAQYGAPPSGVQSVWPRPHAAVHTLLTQTCCEPHAMPQPLQLAESVFVLVQ